MTRKEKMNFMVERLFSPERKNPFMINGRFTCTFGCSSNDCILFSAWEKDINSPSMFSEAKLFSVIDSKNPGKVYSGLISIQKTERDDSYFSSLFLKEDGQSNWQSMFTVVDIDA